MRQRGRIKIHTRRQAEMIEVAISDNGTGLAIRSGFLILSIRPNSGQGHGTGLEHLLWNCAGAWRGIQCWNNEAVPEHFVVRIPVATEAALAAAAQKKRRD